MTSDLRLRPLRLEDEAEFVAAHDELAEEGFTFGLAYDPGQSWPQYLGQLDGYRRGCGLPAGWVPMTFLVADVGGRIRFAFGGRDAPWTCATPSKTLSG